MKKRILLTSFDIWLPHQQSNSSDDLLIEVGKLHSLVYNLTFLRHLPVDVKLASYQVEAKIEVIQPNYIILCGMAESRKKLSVERIASYAENILETTVDLEQLLKEATAIEISDDCGKFVCEGVYYSVLDYLRQHQLIIGCIFVHVPVLTKENFEGIFADFLLIVNKLALL